MGQACLLKDSEVLILRAQIHGQVARIHFISNAECDHIQSARPKNLLPEPYGLSKAFLEKVFFGR